MNMRKRKTLTQKIAGWAYAGICVAVLSSVLYSKIEDFKEESQRLMRIERNEEQLKNQLEDRINNSEIIKVFDIEDAIAKGLEPGKIVSSVDENGRKRVAIYTGKDANGNYELEMLGDYKITVDEAEKQGYHIDNFHAPGSP